jgi:hypothetical protein
MTDKPPAPARRRRVDLIDPQMHELIAWIKEFSAALVDPSDPWSGRRSDAGPAPPPPSWMTKPMSVDDPSKLIIWQGCTAAQLARARAFEAKLKADLAALRASGRLKPWSEAQLRATFRACRNAPQSP